MEIIKRVVNRLQGHWGSSLWLEQSKPTRAGEITKRWLRCDALVLCVLLPQLLGLRLHVPGGLSQKMFGSACAVADSVSKKRGEEEALKERRAKRNREVKGVKRRIKKAKGKCKKWRLMWPSEDWADFSKCPSCGYVWKRVHLKHWRVAWNWSIITRSWINLIDFTLLFLVAEKQLGS